MSELKYCQGPECHTYHTKDRVKGPQGHKTNQTRRRSDFYYGMNNFCSMNCWGDWFRMFGDQAINHFGRLKEAKHLTEENAWVKDYDWRGNPNGSHRHFFVNKITREQRPLTEAQYRDNNYTLNER